MSYQVLARKWRPQAFSDVVGQKHVLSALENGLSLGRLHHAWLFSGTRGVGKTTIARLLAKGLNCETGVTATPCGHCQNCQEIEQGRFVDLIEIDAASRTKVEDTRELLDNVQYAPARGRFKVYLIDEVHMLSRHSFNALLKTLEEPPEHVKFLLATTDPQKLPVTVLSRCLQFHLQALDQELIRGQLEHILKLEGIEAESRALQLLARAADGSMRDGLSLTDQAIATGQGKVEAESVNRMLGTLDDEQALALVEALSAADGLQVMTLLDQVASRGGEWEGLLVEMLRLFHQLAMLQILPTPDAMPSASVDQRLRHLARQLSPEDIQLYYQILLTGRKELPLAPGRRMGVEMTLLRALAFHPKQIMQESAARPLIYNESPLPESSERLPDDKPPVPSNEPVIQPETRTAPALPDATSQLLQARKALLSRKESDKIKKSEPAASDARPAHSSLSRLTKRASFSVDNLQPEYSQTDEPAQPVTKENYCWTAQSDSEQSEALVATPANLRAVLEEQKSSELATKLAEEAQQRDEWAAEIAGLTLPKLVQQLALNAWKEQTETGLCLHLRSSHRHLNNPKAREALAVALKSRENKSVELTVVEDDNPAVLTPLEWQQKVYEEKLLQARQIIKADTHIQTLQRLFDAVIDEESIRPV